LEGTFSQKKNIHSLLRNRLKHSKVKKLIHRYWNLRLLGNMPLDLADMFESVLELDEDDVVGSLRSAGVDEDDNNDDDDDEGDEDDDDKNDDEGEEDDDDDAVRVAFYDCMKARGREVGHHGWL
jgi:hypothetical protein